MATLKEAFFQVGALPVKAYYHERSITGGNPCGAEQVWMPVRDIGSLMRNDALIGDIVPERRIDEAAFDRYCDENRISRDCVLAPVAVTSPYRHDDGRLKMDVLFNHIVEQGARMTGNVVPMIRRATRGLGL